MARSINRLSSRTVDTVSKPGRHSDGGNLFLIVDKPPRRPDGTAGKPAKRWSFLFRWDGRIREMGFGSLNAVSLAKARELASRSRALLADNRNPIEVRRLEQQQSAGRTFGEVAKQLHESRKAGWRSIKHATQWLTSLEAYATLIWDKPVDEVGTDDVLACLKPIWATKGETASRVRGRIEAVLDGARARGLIARDRTNPAQWKGHLAHWLPARQKLQSGHHKALPFAEVPEFVAMVRQRPAMAASCLEFLVLTASRSGEALGARWAEFDLSAKVWIVPAFRMKSFKEHRVPLSDRCLEILRELEPLRTAPEDFVFRGQKRGKPLSTMSIHKLLRRMKQPTTAHGFRSSFRDWAGDSTSFPREVIEAALAHRVGDAVELAYRRSDALEKRRQLMQAWAKFLDGTSASNVLPLKRVAE